MATLEVDAPVPAPARPSRDRLRGALPPLLVFVAVLGLCQFQLIHALLNIKPFQLPLPGQVLAAFGERSRDLWIGTVYTVEEAVVGLIFGAGLGFLTAVLFVQSDFTRRGLMPLAVSANSIPIIAFAPIVSRWLGFDQPTRIVVVTIMTFAPMVISAYKGLTALDNSSLDLMHSYAATPLQIFRKLRLPSSLPYVFSALKVGATAAMIGAVIAEFFNSAGGIGKLIANNIQSGDFALAWCGVVIVTVVGLLLYLAVSLLERVAVPWEAGRRGR
ncbi:MAG TPA: ABC transporter permease [Chloroflexia bacterium]|nr:ABC transporter permease [Chloroflexia bacterium]